ncbi:MAG: peptide deformylase [Firmicutes bacterium]|nr:peptide deformylase [Bacillota bacterium]
MAIRQIVKVNNGKEVLANTSKPVEQFDSKLADLIDDMLDTMVAANGVGLAAVQVGILKRVFVVCVDGETAYEFVNPQIVGTVGEQCETEGCLSVPGVQGVVKRPQKVTVKAQDRYGKEFEITVDGLFARAVCHENDHLNGVLFDSKIMQDDSK